MVINPRNTIQVCRLPGTLVICLLLIVGGARAVPVVYRTLEPDCYTPQEAVDVSIDVESDSSTAVYAAEDVPPDGWIVNNISSGGSWDAGNAKVKWGPFFDNSPRTFSYTAISPVGESGEKMFKLTVSEDGVEVEFDFSYSPCPVTVPDVINMAQTAAESAIADAGLMVGIVTTVCGDTVVVGSVVSQDPAGGVPVSPGSTINLAVSTGPCVPDITPSGYSHDYDSIPVGLRQEWILTITNDGTADLQITGLAGLEASDFSLVNTPEVPFGIEPGTSTDLAVGFTPSSLGPKTATLSITSTDPDENPVDIALMGTGMFAPILYVDADASGANNGTNWQDAFINLQDALGYAKVFTGYVSEVRVAQGVYTPDSNSIYPNGTGDRTASFHLINAVSLKGGYAGWGEADCNARDIEAYKTILSGDLAGNDDTGSGNTDLRLENSLHVAVFSGTDRTATLDGFTVSGGNAVGENSMGGGVYGIGGSATLKNCTISWNWAGYDEGFGGGLYCDQGSPIIINCTFTGNDAGTFDFGYGGGMYCVDSRTVLVNCKFSDNDAGFWSGTGGGMYCSGGSTTLISCTFDGNNAGLLGSGYGGGMYCDGGSPELENCIFTGNWASGDYGNGGGIYCYNSSPAITNCLFLANYAKNERQALGGGMYCDGGSPELENCIFAGNQTVAYDYVGADGCGGGIYFFNSSPTIDKCTFTGNQAIAYGFSSGGYGGGIYCSESSVILTNCTFTTNFSGDYGGGIYSELGDPMLTNCILWGNTDALGSDQWGQIQSNFPEVNYCCVQGWTGAMGGVGNVGYDPLFADPGGPDGDQDTWEGNDYHLQSASGRWDPNAQAWVYDELTSPCIDAGDPASDWAGEWWPGGMRINMGPYGGTAQASKSPASCGDGNIADLNNDGIVNDIDFAIFAFSFKDDIPPGDLDINGAIDLADLGVFSENWLDVVEQGLIGYWKFNEKGGSRAWDSSCNGNHGALVNIDIPSSWIGNGLVFDGIDDYVEVLDSPPLDFSSEMTISVWIYLYANENSLSKVIVKPYIEHVDPWELYCIELSDYQAYPRFIVTDGIAGGQRAAAADPDHTLSSDRWYHLVGTHNENIVSLYIDGELVSTQPADFPIGQNNMPLSIGGRLGANSFNGVIDEVRIYDHAVTEDEVLQLYKQRKHLHKMVYIPAGTFEMGDNIGDGEYQELPIHAVTLDSFSISSTEITNLQYCQFLNSASVKVVNGAVYAALDDVYETNLYCNTSVSSFYSQIVYSGGLFTVRTKNGRDMSDDPVAGVSWKGAAAYCNWRSRQEGYEECYDLSTWECHFTRKGYRLPTEAEWEYAARGGLSGKRFPWGNNISHGQANYYSSRSHAYDVSPTDGYHPDWLDIYPYTAPVGSFSANGYGLYDMSGNVQEWCNDLYGSDYYNSSPADNPTGPVSESFYVLRGGGWSYGRTPSNPCRMSSRTYYDYYNSSDHYRYIDIGFRVVLSLD